MELLHCSMTSREPGKVSGRKQHFIPQSLLKGFGREGKGENIQVNVYTYDRGVFTAGTDGVAAEREFYSRLAVESEAETLDDRITAYETPLARTLAALRGLGDNKAVDSEIAAEFVTHLVVRNDHLRKLMSTAGSALFGGFADAMVDKSQAKALLGLAGEEPSAMFAEQLEKTFVEYGALIKMTGMSQAQFADWAFAHSKANFSEFHAQMIGPFKQVFSESPGKVAETAADAHRRGLSQALSPKLRVEQMKSYEWRIVHSGYPLVLPDCVAVAFDRAGEAFPLMLAEREQVETICVPVSSNRLLVGSRGGKEVPNDLNAAFASCSWDFVVARDRAAELEALRDKIRTRTDAFITKGVEEILAEALGKFSR